MSASNSLENLPPPAAFVSIEGIDVGESNTDDIITPPLNHSLGFFYEALPPPLPDTSPPKLLVGSTMSRSEVTYLVQEDNQATPTAEVYDLPSPLHSPLNPSNPEIVEPSIPPPVFSRLETGAKTKEREPKVKEVNPVTEEETDEPPPLPSEPPPPLEEDETVHAPFKPQYSPSKEMSKSNIVPTKPMIDKALSPVDIQSAPMKKVTNGEQVCQMPPPLTVPTSMQTAQAVGTRPQGRLVGFLYTTGCLGVHCKY